MELLISIAILALGWRIVFGWERKAKREAGYPSAKIETPVVRLDEMENKISE